MRPRAGLLVTGASLRPREDCLSISRSSAIQPKRAVAREVGAVAGRGYGRPMTTQTATAVPTLRSTVPGAAPVRTIDSVNPADLSDVVARVELAGPEALAEAARRANAAQRAWAAVPAPVRGRVIAAIGRLVEANFESLAQLVTREVGKPIVESRGEVQEI